MCLLSCRKVACEPMWDRAEEEFRKYLMITHLETMSAKACLQPPMKGLTKGAEDAVDHRPQGTGCRQKRSGPS